MPIGVFLSKEHKPSTREIAEALGAKYLLWQEQSRFMADSYQMSDDLSFGGKNYGWNVWYRKSGKSLTSLYPHRNLVVAQIVRGQDQVTQALNLPLGPKVGQTLREAPQSHDSRWPFIKITSKRDVRDAEQLVLLKKKPAKAGAAY
jgi:hypothetical protein